MVEVGYKAEGLEAVAERPSFDKHAYRCCCCGAHVKAATLIIAYVKLVLVLTISAPAIHSSLEFSSEWRYTAGALTVVGIVLLLTIVGAHSHQWWLLVPYILLSILTILGLLVSIAGVIYDLMTDHQHLNAALRRVHLQKLTHLSTSIYATTLAYMGVALLLDLWFLGVVSRCMVYFYRRRKARQMQGQIEKELKNNDRLEEEATAVNGLGGAPNGVTTTPQNGVATSNGVSAPNGVDTRLPNGTEDSLAPPRMRVGDNAAPRAASAAYDDHAYLPGMDGSAYSRKRYSDVAPRSRGAGGGEVPPRYSEMAPRTRTSGPGDSGNIYDRVASVDSGDYTYPEIVFHPNGKVADNARRAGGPGQSPTVISKGYMISCDVQG